jgi:hypothetical protein
MANKINNSTSLMKIVCAILFIVFTFCYLYYYQADILAVGQHVLSNGQTHYGRTIGAILITIVLFLLQLGIYALTRLEKRSHAVTYFPSLLILAVITDISPDIDLHFSFGAWLWVIPLLLIFYVFIVWGSRLLQPYEPETKSVGLFSKVMWINVLTMSIMFVMVALISNHNDVFHYRMRAENCLVEKDYAGALKAGENSLATDSSLTMIRAYALAKEGKIGDKLFQYPVVGSSKVLLPDGLTTKLMIYPESDVYKDLGIWLKQKMPPLGYLQYIERHHFATKMGIDYLLTAYLLDRNLDAFVHTVRKYYKLGSSLPTHYREALILYTHLRSNPVVVYHSNVMDADYQDYQQLYHSESNEAIRMTKLRDTYGNTYWYYYQFGK